jgi:hypothetical protein
MNAGESEQIATVVRAEEKQAEVEERTDLVQSELELGDDAEVAAAANRPEQVGVFGRDGVPGLAVRGDHLCADEVVARQACLAHQPADPAAEG